MAGSSAWAGNYLPIRQLAQGTLGNRFCVLDGFTPHQPTPVSRKLEAVFNAGLFEDVHQVHFHCAGRNRQCVCDFLVLEAYAYVLDDVLLARSQMWGRATARSSCVSI